MEIDLLPSKYTLIKKQEVPDCRGTGFLLKHKKSGARISIISNDDNNKAFCIAFRTAPSDDTGVAHILEHSVLCGSRKFKPKDPFMELAKGSLNTYLNALTFPDKTCYPVASCNDRDFANLMDVYLDAVFYPAIYEKEEIFRQEGWHYELEDEEDDPELNGIVYSEMKGVFSSPEERLARRTMRELFPDNAYVFESGGDPRFIPDLTYEEFLEFHKRYYHPSNSYISLYGDMDVTERLEFLDREYLSGFDAIEPAPCVELQEAIGERESSGYYPLADEDPEEDAAFINWAFMLADNSDVKTNTALGLVCQVLFDITGAPVKEALIKNGLGREICFSAEEEIRQPFGTLSVRNIDAGRLPEVKTTVVRALEKAVSGGLNRRSLQSALTRMEFMYREEDFGTMPKGLIYIFRSLAVWLYDENEPFKALDVKSCFEELRELIDTGYYEDLVKKYMLSPQTSAWCVLMPKRGLDREEDEALAARMHALKEGMSPDETVRMLSETVALREYQQTPSTPEELLTVPMLKREDISQKGVNPLTTELALHEVPVLLHEVETNGIVYADAMFEVNGIEKEDVPYLGLMLRLLGNMDTKNYTYLELDNECGIHTGGIGASVSTYKVNGTDEYRPVLSMSGKAFAREMGELVRLFAEVFLETDFSSLERAREVIREWIADLRGMFAGAGHRVAVAAARAAVSGADAFMHSMTGRGIYDFLCSLENAPDDDLRAKIDHGREILDRIIKRNGLTINVTASREVYDGIAGTFESLLRKLDEHNGTGAGTESRAPQGRGPRFETGSRRLAYKNAGDVNYVALAGIHECTSPDEAGWFTILSSILSNEYLWNNIRVLGGAYGCGFGYRRQGGSMSFYSYRDPSVGKTLEIFNLAADYIESFDADEREMTKFIIGTIGAIDTPMTPDMKGRFSLSCYMSGVDGEWIQKRREAILGATCEDIRKLAAYVRRVTELGNICVVGSEGDIEAESSLFSEVKNLF